MSFEEMVHPAPIFADGYYRQPRKSTSITEPNKVTYYYNNKKQAYQTGLIMTSLAITVKGDSQLPEISRLISPDQTGNVNVLDAFFKDFPHISGLQGLDSYCRKVDVDHWNRTSNSGFTLRKVGATYTWQKAEVATAARSRATNVISKMIKSNDDGNQVKLVCIKLAFLKLLVLFF
jgi:hypothetical protein